MINKFNNFVEDVKGIITKPGITLGRLMENKQWIGAFLFICITVFVITYLSAPAIIKQLAQTLPEDQIGGLREATATAKTFVSLSMIFILFLKLVIVAFFIYLFFGIGGAEGVYVNYFSITMNAAIVGTLIPGIIQSILLLFHIKIALFSDLTVLFPGMSPESWKYVILSQFEFFSIWFIIIVALGVSTFSKMNKIKCLVISIFYFIFKSTVIILFSMLLIKLKNSLIT